MQRLTKQWGKNPAVPTELDLGQLLDLDDKTWKAVDDIIQRLADYEDILYAPDGSERITLDHLKSLMLDGTPVYYIQQGRIYESSIASFTVDKAVTYIRLEDGTGINIAQFDSVAFWTKEEARKAVNG